MEKDEYTMSGETSMLATSNTELFSTKPTPAIILKKHIKRNFSEPS